LLGKEGTGMTLTKMLYSRKDARFVLSISIRSIDHLVKTKALKAKTIGGRILIPHEELVRYSSSDQGPLTPK
jgi:hypothetical protein